MRFGHWPNESVVSEVRTVVSLRGRTDRGGWEEACGLCCVLPPRAGAASVSHFTVGKGTELYMR